jgi:AbrB family looped-hinge helix DNA binding protein
MAEFRGCAVTSEGQMTIPKLIHQQLGLHRGSRVYFEMVGDHLEARPASSSTASGFGLLKTTIPAVPSDFDPAFQFSYKTQGLSCAAQFGGAGAPAPACLALRPFS